MPRTAALPVLLALCALPAAASPPLSPRGPLRVDNAYPLLLPFAVPPAEDPGGPPGLTLSLSATYGNGFHWDPELLYPDLDVLLDAEVLKLCLSASWGLARGLSLQAALSLVGQYGGFLDPAIQGVHAAFGLPNGDRELAPNNRYGVRIAYEGQVLLDLEEPSAAPGDLLLGAKWALGGGQGDGFSAALQAALSLPLGSVARLASSGRPGASLGLLGSWRRSAFAAYGGLRYLALGRPPWAEALGFRPHNLGFFAALEWAPAGRAAWLLQADGMTTPYLHPHPWLRALSGTLSLGSRFRLGPRLLLEAHLSEELFSFATLDIAAGCVATLAL